MNFFDTGFFADLSVKAKGSKRLRTNFNIHSSYEDPCQRVVIAIEPQSYIQPHRHVAANKTETFILLQGRVVIVFFNDVGEVVHSRELSSVSGMGGCSLVEVQPSEWHTVFALESNTIFLETKQGPFSPSGAKDSAPFAPNEADIDAADYLMTLMTRLGYLDA